MELIRGIHNIRARHHGCVLTIGNFDGVHRGHQALLEQLKQQGKRLGLPVMVMIFEPQPLEMFAADKAPARLTRLRDKANYSAGGRRLPAVRQVRSAFCRQHRAGVRRRAAGGKTGRQIPDGGDDFRFGAGRQGDFSLLQQAGKEYGFEVVSTPTFREGERRISSTAIRTALSEDDLPLAETLLGHPYSISGRVVHGDELGRTIGFPTANLPLQASGSAGERGVCGRSVRHGAAAAAGRGQYRYAPDRRRRAPAAGSASAGCHNGSLRAPY